MTTSKPEKPELSGKGGGERDNAIQKNPNKIEGEVNLSQKTSDLFEIVHDTKNDSYSMLTFMDPDAHCSFTSIESFYKYT